MTSERSPAPQSAQETFERLALRVLQGDGLTEAERRIAAGAISAFGKTPSDRQRSYENGLEDAAQVCFARAANFDDAGRCETASVLAHRILALKNTAPQTPDAVRLGTVDRAVATSDGAVPCVVGTTATSIPNPRTGR